MDLVLNYYLKILLLKKNKFFSNKLNKLYIYKFILSLIKFIYFYFSFTLNRIKHSIKIKIKKKII